jgi:hypothetical protein
MPLMAWFRAAAPITTISIVSLLSMRLAIYPATVLGSDFADTRVVAIISFLFLKISPQRKSLAFARLRK